MKKKLSITEILMAMPHYPNPTWGPCTEPSRKLSRAERIDKLERIKEVWELNKDQDIFKITEPKKLTGAKSRRLVCTVASGQKLPWGWLSSPRSKEGLIFKNFRKIINAHLKSEPLHKIDHIDFKNHN